MTVATPRSAALAGTPARVSPCTSAAAAPPAAMDLNSCRQAIERAAATKVSATGSSLTIRQCLLQAGLSVDQASNRTMQARVRREVQRRQTHGPGGAAAASRKIAAAASTAARPVPREIYIPIAHTIPGDDFDDFDSWCAEVLDDDEISAITDPSCFQSFAMSGSCVSPPLQLPYPQHQHTGTPRPTNTESSSSPIPSARIMPSMPPSTTTTTTMILPTIHEKARPFVTTTTTTPSSVDDSPPFLVPPEPPMMMQYHGQQQQQQQAQHPHDLSMFRLTAMPAPCVSR